MEQAILYGDAMDAQILGVLKRHPKAFHIAMIPDMRAYIRGVGGESDRMETAEQVEAEQNKWQVELELLKANLKLDQKLMRQTEIGSRILYDFGLARH